VALAKVRASNSSSTTGPGGESSCRSLFMFAMVAAGIRSATAEKTNYESDARRFRNWQMPLRLGRHFCVFGLKATMGGLKN